MSPPVGNTSTPPVHWLSRLRAGWFGGVLLMGGAAWIVTLAPAALPAGIYHILGLFLALLSSLFAFFLMRQIGSEAQYLPQTMNSLLGKIKTKAIGSLAIFMLVLVWWWSPLAPISIETIATEKIDEPPQVQPHIGDHVLSNWKKSGYFYPGKIIDVKEGKYRIFYEFSDEEWVEENDFISRNIPSESELQINTKVYVQIDRYQNKWAPAVIKDIKSNKYLVAYTDNNNSYHEWVPLQKLVR
jgi:Domain of unknown function (DUF4537)